MGKKTPGDCKGGGKHGGRKLKIRTQRLPHPDASQSDAIHENQSALRTLMLMKSATQAFICFRLRHASGNLYNFFFLFFFSHPLQEWASEREEERGRRSQDSRTQSFSLVSPTLPSHIASWEQRLSLKSSALPVTSPHRHPLTQPLPALPNSRASCGGKTQNTTNLQLG